MPNTPSDSTSPERERNGRREAKKEALRDCIERTALRLFVENGFENTTVEQIALRAEVAERTFYRYFPTKDDVVFWRATDRIPMLKDTLRDLQDGYPAGRDLDWLMDALRRYVQLLDADGELQRMRAQIIRRSPHLTLRAIEVYGGLGEIFAKEVARRRGGRTPDLYARMAASVAVGIASAATREWGLRQGRTSLPECLERAIEAFDAITDPVRVGA